MGTMSTRRATLEMLAAALRETQAVADRTTPEDLGLPTPCQDYDVRRLLEHIIGWQLLFADCAAGRQPALVDGSPSYTASSDPAADLRAASAALVENLRHRSDPVIAPPYRGSTRVQLLVDELLAETVIHTWDLATAIGATVQFDDRTVAAAHTGLSELLAESFADIGFRPPEQPAVACSEFQRLLLRSGRRLRW
jgi:uncharacterized protein (TIGR03086 family)